VSAPSSLHVLVGVTGGIAAYKTADLVSRLVKRGDVVTVAMTASATKFVGADTFAALSGRAVLSNPWDVVDDYASQHVALSRTINAMIIAPCSMNSLAKFACGGATDMVSLLVAAIDRTTTPVVLSPSMNDAMWHQPATQRNIETLQADGFTMLTPDTGWQACRTDGCGRMPEPSDLLKALDAAMTSVNPPRTS
jgi:phosphopantothenoylcysteine decarboxylase/phosphopantothenate--cysteine ligase